MKYLSTLLIGLALILGFGATHGCTETFEKVFYRQDKQKIENKVFNEELEKNRQLWREQNITDYKITADIRLGPIRYSKPIMMKVESGKNISIEPIDKKDVSNSEYQRNMGEYQTFGTVETMFDTIQEVLNKEQVSEKRVFVKYNKKFGYPDEIVIGTLVIDGMILVKIKKFEIIKDLSRS